MKIENDKDRDSVVGMIAYLTNAVEQYDRATQNASVCGSFTSQYITPSEVIEAARRQYEENLQMRFEHSVKGSLEPHSLDDSGPRGYIFFKDVKW